MRKSAFAGKRNGWWAMSKSDISSFGNGGGGNADHAVDDAVRLAIS